MQAPAVESAVVTVLRPVVTLRGGLDGQVDSPWLVTSLLNSIEEDKKLRELVRKQLVVDL